MQIKENVFLAPYTTFKIGGPARFFCVVKEQFDALEAFEFANKSNLKIFVLGGGSNILVSDEGFGGLVIKVESKGIEVVDIGDDILLKVASAETWDQVVAFAVKNGWWGVENLSHIPGSTGAIAVQNVGAYGQEAKNVIESVTVFNKETHEIQSLSNKACGFGYRSSIFNTSAKGKYIIFSLTFKLTKNGRPVLSYRDLEKTFAGYQPSLPEVREAVINIRDQKFPFPLEAKNGNAGSFFKNPIFTLEDYQNFKGSFQAKFPEDIVEKMEQKVFLDGDKIKVPAAFLMDVCGLKGLKNGGAAINHNQPLVIINETGAATAKDVLNLAEKVREVIKEKTGIALQFEPELIGF